MDEEKYFTSTEVLDDYNSRTDSQKITILLLALDLMAQYNGRTKFHCIAIAMGYENSEGGINTYTKP